MPVESSAASRLSFLARVACQGSLGPRRGIVQQIAGAENLALLDFKDDLLNGREALDGIPIKDDEARFIGVSQFPDLSERENCSCRGRAPDVDQLQVAHDVKGVDIESFRQCVGPVGIASKGEPDAVSQQESKVLCVELILHASLRPGEL